LEYFRIIQFGIYIFIIRNKKNNSSNSARDLKEPQ